MTSLRARLLTARLWLQRDKLFYADTATMRRQLPTHQVPQRARPPGWMKRRYRIARTEVDGFDCYTIEPAGGPRVERHIFHMHGGGFVESPEAHHWRFAARMVDRLGCRYTMPMYPLAPGYDHRTIVPMVEEAYRRILDSTPVRDRVVFGDSAGGTLALTLARHLREQGQPQPVALALFSPWIDLATDDDDSLVIDPVDPELGVTGLQQAGRWGRALDDPEISPAFADLVGCPPIVVFIGSHDILLPDARRIKRLGDEAGVRVDLHEYPDMFHNWIMKNIPEAKESTRALVDFLRSVDEEDRR